MSFTVALIESIYQIERHPYGFQRHVDIIKQTTYKQKLPFEPFPNYSTTYGKRYCRLANDWHKWIAHDVPQPVYHFARMANLIHEAHHSMQRDHMGNVSFNASWIQKQGRYRIELEAYCAQIRYMLLYFGMTKQQAEAYIKGQALLLVNGYFLGSDYPFDRIVDDMMSMV